jgi:hypothetical protein
MTPKDSARLHTSWHHTLVHLMNCPLFAYNGIMQVYSSREVAQEVADELNRRFECTDYSVGDTNDRPTEPSYWAVR